MVQYRVRGFAKFCLWREQSVLNKKVEINDKMSKYHIYLDIGPAVALCSRTIAAPETRSWRSPSKIDQIMDPVCPQLEPPYY